ncbi:MAG: hypothetical protein ACRD30_04720 [Bryobacteraceae bacterium]
MNLIPNKVGADRKKLAFLGGLLLVLVAVFFLNRDSTPTAAVKSTSISAREPAASTPRPVPPERRSIRDDRSVEDFKPSLKPREGVDLSRIDPSLKLDLLARLQNVPMEAGTRGSVFAFGQAPAPPPPKVKIDPGAMPVVNRPAAPKPSDPPKGSAGPAVAPIPLQFFGYANAPHGGPKRAFFLDGDDIQVAGENEVIRNRYKVIHIGINSVVMEDTASKSQQTLKLVEELAG